MLMREDIKAAIEAILFVRAEPVELNELLEILELPAADVKEILEELIEEYNSTKRGLQIAMVDRGIITVPSLVSMASPTTVFTSTISLILCMAVFIKPSMGWLGFSCCCVSIPIPPDF